MVWQVGSYRNVCHYGFFVVLGDVKNAVWKKEIRKNFPPYCNCLASLWYWDGVCPKILHCQSIFWSWGYYCRWSGVCYGAFLQQNEIFTTTEFTVNESLKEPVLVLTLILFLVKFQVAIVTIRCFKAKDYIPYMSNFYKILKEKLTINWQRTYTLIGRQNHIIPSKFHAKNWPFIIK